MVRRITKIDKWANVHTTPKLKEPVKKNKEKSVKQMAMEYSKEVHPQKIELLDIREEEADETDNMNSKKRILKEDRDGFLDLT